MAIQPTDFPSDPIEQQRWLVAFLETARICRWFGTITIEVKRGQIMLVKREETFKPTSSK